MQRDSMPESISRSATGKQELCTSNASLEDTAAKNTLYSSCNQQFNQPHKVLYTGKPESVPSSDHVSKVKSQVTYHSNVKPSLPFACTGSQQMSSFERACYEDFQMYIPEITAETQFTVPGKHCEDNSDCGNVSSTCSVVNQDCVLTHYPSSSYNVSPSARHYYEVVEPFPFKDSKDRASSTLGNCQYNDAGHNLCMSQERHPDLHFSNNAYSRSLKNTPQPPPNKVANHYGQQLCPTVSIRVDISCPVSPCGCNKISCCCRDACSKSSIQHRYGNIPRYSSPGNQSNSVVMPSLSNFQQGLPGGFNAKANPFSGKYNEASSYTNSYNADYSKNQFKLGDYGDADIKPYPPRYEDVANNNGFSLRGSLNNYAFYTNVAAQNGKCVASDQRFCQSVGSSTSDKKFPIPNARTETVNPSAIKYQDKMRWEKNISENFSTNEKSFVSAKNGSSPLDGNQTGTKGLHFHNNVTNPYQEIVELRPVDPGKIFGQYKYQTSGKMLIGEKCMCPEPRNKTYLQSPPVCGDGSPAQAENPTSMNNVGRLSKSLLMEPSSPIANLSNLVAKIHPDHGNIMTGRKNVKVEGKSKVNFVGQSERCRLFSFYTIIKEMYSYRVKLY